MANTKKSAARSKNEAVIEKPDVNVEDVAPIVPKHVDMNQYISVKNGFQGKLIYKSSRTGERFVWDEFGDEQDMELGELKNAKSSHKRFFCDNWFMFDKDDSWVIDFLGVRQFYKHALGLEDFDDVFKKSPAELKKIISELSNGQKKSLSYRASEMIASGEIDSRKTIAALEEALGVELIEK